MVDNDDVIPGDEQVEFVGPSDQSVAVILRRAGDIAGNNVGLSRLLQNRLLQKRSLSHAAGSRALQKAAKSKAEGPWGKSDS